MKHPSFFPYLILALTLILVAGFVFTASPKSAKQANTSVEPPSVSDEQYQAALRIVLNKFTASFDAAAEDSVRASVTDQTLSTLLSMRVPAEEKDLHLSLAIALQKIKQGFVSNPQDMTDGYAQIKVLILQTSWLHL